MFAQSNAAASWRFSIFSFAKALMLPAIKEKDQFFTDQADPSIMQLGGSLGGLPSELF